jgi:hypothetical protein
MKRRLFLPLVYFLMAASGEVWAEGRKTEVIGTFYFGPLFGHVHQSPSSNSSTHTNIACGHPIRVLSQTLPDGRKVELFEENWRLVSVGPFEGYLRDRDLVRTKPTCFQDQFPRFMNALNLELTDMYNWGKLYDNYETGRSKLP